MFNWKARKQYDITLTGYENFEDFEGFYNYYDKTLTIEYNNTSLKSFKGLPDPFHGSIIIRNHHRIYDFLDTLPKVIKGTLEISDNYRKWESRDLYSSNKINPEYKANLDKLQVKEVGNLKCKNILLTESSLKTISKIKLNGNLHLESNYLFSLKGLEKTKGIKNLYIGHNQLEDVKGIPEFDGDLSLEFNKLVDLSDLPETINGTLDLYSCSDWKRKSKNNLKHLKNLGNLKRVKKIKNLWNVYLDKSFVFPELEYIESLTLDTDSKPKFKKGYKLPNMKEFSVNLGAVTKNTIQVFPDEVETLEFIGSNAKDKQNLDLKLPKATKKASYSMGYVNVSEILKNDLDILSVSEIKIIDNVDKNYTRSPFKEDSDEVQELYLEDINVNTKGFKGLVKNQNKNTNLLLRKMNLNKNRKNILNKVDIQSEMAELDLDFLPKNIGKLDIPVSNGYLKRYSERLAFGEVNIQRLDVYDSDYTKWFEEYYNEAKDKYNRLGILKHLLYLK